MKLEISIITLGKLQVAVTSLGGILVRGRPASDRADAVRNLLWKLAGKDGDDDAQLAVELAVHGTDLSAATTAPALTDGAGD